MLTQAWITMSPHLWVGLNQYLFPKGASQELAIPFEPYVWYWHQISTLHFSSRDNGFKEHKTNERKMILMLSLVWIMTLLHLRAGLSIHVVMKQVLKRTPTPTPKEEKEIERINYSPLLKVETFNMCIQVGMYLSPPKARPLGPTWLVTSFWFPGYPILWLGGP